MQRLLFKSWPFGAIILAIVVFFYPVWLQNKIPLPADFIVGTYYPWLDYKWQGYPFGVPVKNPITTDVVSFSYPMRTYAIDLLKQGIAPLWNPLILTGTPLLANFQSAPFSPTNIFYFILPKFDAWTLQIIAQPLLAAVFLYLLLREFKRSKLASLAGGLFFAFSGFMIIWLEWNAHSLVAAFFPLIILLTLKWLKTNKVLWGSCLSLVLALQIFSGYPQIILYEFLTFLVMVLTFDPKVINLRKIFGLAFFICLGIGLAAIQILPGLELLKLSQRKIEDVINVSAFLPIQMVISFVAPDFFGNHVTRNYWGPGDYTLVTGYSGVITIILSSVGLITGFREKYIKFGISLIILSLFIAFENPVSSWVRDSGFLGLQAASAHRILILSNLGFAILAAFGVDKIIENNIKFRDFLRFLYIPGILITSFTLASLFILKLYDLPLIDSTKFKVGIKNLILPGIFYIFSSIVLFLSVKFKNYSKGFVIILIFAGILEFFRFGWKFTPFSPKELVFPETPVLEFLQNQRKPFRVAAEDVIPINMMMVYGIETTEGYDAVYPLKYAKYLSTLNSNSTDADPMGRYGSVSNYDSILLNLSNTKYVLALLRNESGSVDSSGKIPQKFLKNDALKIAFRDKSVTVLENTNYLERAKMFYEWEVSEDDTKTLNSLLNTPFPFEEKLILSKKPGIVMEKGKGNAIYSGSPNKKKIDVETDKEGILFIGDSLYPGWEAYVDGKKTDIIKADYNFMAVPIIEVGNHEVLITYMPENFKIGSILSLASLNILILIFLSFKMRRWRTISH